MKEGGFDASADLRDGVPEDIETGWVAVTPVPSGKRCIAVTHQTSGIAGVGESLLVYHLDDPILKDSYSDNARSSKRISGARCTTLSACIYPISSFVSADKE